MALKELTLKITLEVTGNEVRAINKLMTSIKNSFEGDCNGEQHYTGDYRNYAYRVNEIKLEENTKEA